jgi:sulfite reductase (ferredoxin)
MPSSTRPTRTKETGQWALGQHAPLNPNEVFKQQDDGLNVRARVEQVYAKEGFASIPADDLRGRLRWWGLYTQRKPGIDGGRTASLPPEELDDEYFMLRIRSDGGLLTLDQLRTIADISIRFGRDTADITDRQNIQLHWIRIEDMPEIWRLLESVGLSTTEACGDTPRVVLGSPVAGIAADEIVDGTPAIHEIVRRYVGSSEYSNLPRKFKSAVSGSPRQDVAHEINDVSFIGVIHPDHGPGFDVWVGGGLSTNPMVAQRLGAWVPLDEVPDVWEGIIGIFRDYGYRRLRNRARLKFLVADWGAQKFREVLETEYLKRPLLDGPAPGEPTGRRDHVGIHPQIDGKFYVGAAPTVGRVSGTLLQAIAELMDEHGTHRLRLTAQQKFVILDIERPGLLAEELRVRRGAMACTGIEFCKLAIVETKARTADMVDRLEQRFGTALDDTDLSIHVNGCPNSCARFQIADIGFKGSLVPDVDGEMVEGFQVHLGGRLGPNAGFGRKLRALKVTADEMPEYVERVLATYTQQRQGDESFADWVERAEEDALR